MDHHHHFGFVVIGFALAIIAVLAGFLTYNAPITGNIVATGGQISHINLDVGSNNIRWVGIFGNISTNGSNGTQEFASGQVIAVNLSFSDSVSNNTLILLSTDKSISWDNLSPASFADINNYMGVLSSSAYSAENTLTTKKNFTINSTIYELWSAQTNSVNGTYITGAIKDQDTLMFITRAVGHSYGFMNSLTDYQILFPISHNNTANISFRVFNNPSNLSSLLNCNNLSSNISAKVSNDNNSIEFSWNVITGATSYDIVYIEGPTSGLLDFSSPTIINLGSNTSWIDSTPSNERYYRLRVHDAIGSCMENTTTTGTLVVNVSPEFNLLSTPFISEDTTISEVLKSIKGNYNEVYEFDNDGKIYAYYIIVGQTIFRTFNDIVPTKTYWIKTSTNDSLRLAGILSKEVNESISPDFNLMGFPTISNSIQDNTLTHVFSSINGNFTEVYEFDNNNKIYEYYILVGQTIFRTFNNINPGKAYWIRTNVSEQLVYAND